MSRLASIGVAILLLGACTSEGEPQDPPSPTGVTADPSTTVAPARYGVVDCPVDDEALCATAVEVIEALQDGDAEDLFAQSRESRLVCAEVATEYFPACDAEDDVLNGYGLSGPTFIVEVVDGNEYRNRLEAFAGGIDPSFSDDLGSGDVRLVGVGTCGPDIPGRRTYHLAWTAASRDAGDTAERVLGSFELTLEDDRWAIALWYVGSLDEWEAEQPDPLELAFCEAGLTPWPPLT